MTRNSAFVSTITIRNGIVNCRLGNVRVPLTPMSREKAWRPTRLDLSIVDSLPDLTRTPGDDGFTYLSHVSDENAAVALAEGQDAYIIEGTSFRWASKDECLKILIGNK
jgi:hypothetical protein